MSLSDRIVNLESVNCCDVNSIQEAIREVERLINLLDIPVELWEGEYGKGYRAALSVVKFSLKKAFGEKLI